MYKSGQSTESVLCKEPVTEDHNMSKQLLLGAISCGSSMFVNQDNNPRLDLKKLYLSSLCVSMTPNELAEYVVLSFVLFLLLLLLILVGYVCKKLWPKKTDFYDRTQYEKHTRSDMAVVTLDTNSSVEILESNHHQFRVNGDVNGNAKKEEKLDDFLVRTSDV
ncbi:hypothetical protein AC249_AIPGENE6027 [Exaiptasia diaphana]|nr:hypothetical protein AC249_AIPGENE6027 [Exaiptasia diaphana]